ncbi:MAG TPA: hypothetical protein VGR90_10725 [Acidimicrobiales bacterium]|nr:hypothetical protein [Acidimicrobiales bacterium]
MRQGGQTIEHDRRRTHHRRTRRYAGAALLAAGGLATLLPTTAGAVSGTGSNQTVTFTPSPLLSIAASPVSLSGLTTPSATVPVSLSSVVVTDTEADSTNWTASVAASSCFLPSSGLPATLNTNSATLPATALTYTGAGGAPTVALTTGTPASAVSGGTNAFGPAPGGGTLATPAFGTPLTVASTTASNAALTSDPLNNDGTYTLTPSLSINMSGSSSFVPVSQLYTCTLQYTITG